MVLSKKFKEEKNRELSTASAKVVRNADNRQTNRQSNLIRSTGEKGGNIVVVADATKTAAYRNCSKQFSIDKYRYNSKC